MKIFVHGIGEFDRNTVEDKAHKLLGYDAYTVYWADIFDEDERYILNKYKRHSWIDKMLISYFGDVVAYHSEKRQEAISRVVDAIELADKDEKVILVAHSWGTVIAYEALTQMKDKDHIIFITLASPLPLYAMKHSIKKFTNAPILVEWYNITYKNDIYGFPLKPLNDVFDLAVIEDYVLSPMIWSYIPIIGRFIAHSDYFRDYRIKKLIKNLIT